MTDIDLGPLEHGPHANLIRDISAKCAADMDIQAIWIGGSLATGTGDRYSDIDFRIAVPPDQVERWTTPDWNTYFPLQPVGGELLRFGDHALLHHLILSDGTILDFYVQDTTVENPEPNVVILLCRDAEFTKKLDGFARPADTLARDIDPAAARQFLVEYWITTHKQMKALARQDDLSAFVGLYFERLALLRGWYMQALGKDLNARATLHMLGALHKGLAGKLSASQRSILGLPSRTPAETVAVIDAIRAEMSIVGRDLAKKYGFEYPEALEAVVQRVWDEHKAALIAR